MAEDALNKHNLGSFIPQPGAGGGGGGYPPDQQPYVPPPAAPGPSYPGYPGGGGGGAGYSMDGSLPVYPPQGQPTMNIFNVSQIKKFKNQVCP